MWQGAKQGMLWAVSQASPLRSVHVDYDLQLYEYEPPYQGAGYSSGGFMANSVVGRQVHLGSQQQWFFRNNEMPNFDPLGGVFNFVFVGTVGAPESHCNPKWTANMMPFTTVDQTPTIAEKPYIVMGDNGKYSLAVPTLRVNSSGTTWSANSAAAASGHARATGLQQPPLQRAGSAGEGSASAFATTVGFENVYVAKNATDTSATINEKLAAGLHLLITPGIYQLEAALELKQKGQIVLGIGMATLVSAAGQPCIRVGAVPGVRVAGLLLQAGPVEAPTLLEWGPEGGFAGDETDPGVISDVFVRVGGPEPPEEAEKKTKVAVLINSGHVIIDNAWLWRADHTMGGEVCCSKNPSLNGLVRADAASAAAASAAAANDAGARWGE
jgi:hypothetical protein